jgi:hypothetical protein
MNHTTHYALYEAESRARKASTFSDKAGTQWSRFLINGYKQYSSSFENELIYVKPTASMPDDNWRAGGLRFAGSDHRDDAPLKVCWVSGCCPS